jgi:Zn-dependent M28 family amino/carboxypeptidase
MTRFLLIGLLIAAGAAAAIAISAGNSSAQTLDIDELLSRIDAKQLRAHVEAIAEPRNAFAQPARLQQTADYVQSQLESFGYDVALDDVTYQDATFPNVYAEQRGTSCPDRIFVVGGHYDSVEASPGADDDASGTSGMLEIARALADTPLPATVRFAGFTMEEEGLIGSRKMAADLAAQDAQVVGMMSLEMIGYTAGPGNDFLAVLGNTASIRLTDAVHRASETYVPGFPAVVLNLEGNGEEQPDSSRSDHAPFWRAGYQALLVTDTANFRNSNYHQPSDTIDTLDFDFMTNSAKAMLATTVDYLTYDGDHDGETDVCSGPLAATPTATGATGSTGPFPPHTATPEPVLPGTGDGTGQDHGWPAAWVWVVVAVAVLVGAGGVAQRLRR